MKNDYKINIRCTGNNNGDGGCNSLLEVMDDDIYVTCKVLNNTYPNYCYTFKCPCCNIETDIDEKDIPIKLRILLLKDLKTRIVYSVGREKEYEG